MPASHLPGDDRALPEACATEIPRRAPQWSNRSLSIDAGESILARSRGSATNRHSSISSPAGITRFFAIAISARLGDTAILVYAGGVAPGEPSRRPS